MGTGTTSTDSTTPPAGTEPVTGQAAEGTTGTENPPAAPAAPVVTPDDLAAVKRALDAERRTSRDANAQLQQALAKLKAAEDAELTESQRVTRERDDYKSKWEQELAARTTRTARDAISAAAAAAGAIDAAAVAQLADAAKFTADADNSVDLVAALRTQFPALFKDPNAQTSPAPPAAGPVPGLGGQEAGAGKGAPKHFTRQQVEAMTDEDYRANRDLIIASMATWK